MLFKILGALLNIEREVNSNGMASQSQKKMTSKERAKHEYDLWVMSEEFEDSDE